MLQCSTKKHNVSREKIAASTPDGKLKAVYWVGKRSGKQFINNFEIKEWLGEGTYSKVYQANQYFYEWSKNKITTDEPSYAAKVSICIFYCI